MVHTPLTNVPAQGCGCVVVVVDGGAAVVVVVVDDAGGVVVVVVDGGALVVVVEVGGFVVVVVVPAVGSFVVVVVPVVVVVVVDELTGRVEPSLDGTQSPNPHAKNRRGFGATRAVKQTRSVAPASIGCSPEGAQSSHGWNTRAVRPLTVTGNGGVNRTELCDG
jgi:hypothetical protein